MGWLWNYIKFEKKEIDGNALYKTLVKRIYMRPKIYLYQALKAMKQGNRQLVKSLFEKCIHPHTINFPEHQVAVSL
jgi:hypothetical protein